MSTKKIGIVVGSLRKESFSKKIAANMAELFPEGFETDFIAIDKLDMYDQDLDDENRPPAAWTSFREQLGQYDAFMFVTPEYNRSVPAVLKNALDVGSRPYGQNKWGGKPGAVVSVSPGAISGFGAHHHLRQVLVFLDIYTMQQPEAYIGNVANILDSEGKVTNEGTLDFLKLIVNSFVDWINRTSN